jgi:hypothetical protein
LQLRHVANNCDFLRLFATCRQVAKTRLKKLRLCDMSLRFCDMSLRFVATCLMSLQLVATCLFVSAILCDMSHFLRHVAIQSWDFAVSEILESQSKDKGMNKLAKKEKYTFQLVENTKVLCKDGKLVIPNDLQHIEPSAGTTTTCNIQVLPAWKRPFALRCIGKACGLTYVHMSKSVKLVKFQNFTIYYDTTINLLTQ